MNAEQLLAHFDRISEAPDAIPSLRRFILDLAVRGKLVEQDPKDEPAPELLKRIQAERVDRVDYRRKSTEFPGIVDSELPFSTPAGWLWVHFGEIHDLVRGVTYTKSDVTDAPAPGYSPILRANNISLSLNFNELVFVRKECIGPEQKLRRGDYLIALSSGSKHLVGKAAFVDADYQAGFGGFCGVIRLVSPHFEPFAGVFLSSKLYRDAISAGSRGIGINNLKRETLDSVLFPLPPLAEQQRIVARVNELMSLCDRLKTAKLERESRRDRLTVAILQRLSQPSEDATAAREHARFYLRHLPRLTARLEQIKQLRQTILDLAVRGKLGPQDPNDEPASELLKQIQVDEARRVKDRGMKTMLSPIDEERAPFTLPQGWAWARFPELGIFERGKSKHRPRNDPSLFEGGTHFFVQTGDVARSNGIIATYTKKYNERGLSQSAKWPKGTLCITIAANIADSGILSFDACFPDSIVGFIPSPMIPDAKYFEYFIRTIKAALSNFAPATAQKNINLSILNEVLIPLPPLAEQRRIVNKTDELMALCDSLEAHLLSTQIESHRLLEALLHEALTAT